MGDFNTKIRKEISNQEVAGMYTLHDVTSGDGQKLIQFAHIHDTYVVCTKHEHKKIHNSTWIIPGTMATNQTHHVLINTRLSSIKNVWSIRGPNRDSVHYLAREKYKQEIMRIQDDKYKKRNKWNQEKLDDPSFAKEYRTEIIRAMVQKGVSHQV